MDQPSFGNGLTPIAALGEFALVKRLTAKASHKNPSTLMGVGDDAALVLPPTGQAVLASQELFVEGVHFDLAFHPLPHLGYKCVTAAIADLLAMNAKPSQILVSVGLSSKFSVESVEQFYEGIHAACAHYALDLIGGDTTAALSGLTIGITALGYAMPEDVVKRSTAASGDLIVVSGDVGGAYAGLQVLRREKEVYLADPTMQPELDDHQYIIGRQLKPEARVDIMEMLGKIGVRPTAMIDLSDGIASDLRQICTASQTGCRLYEDKLPIDENTRKLCQEFGIDPTVAALNGGEDYELLFTVAQSDFPKIEHNPDLSIIGYMTDATEGYAMISRGGEKYPLTAQGWGE